MEIKYFIFGAIANLLFNINSNKANYIDNEVALFCCFEDIDMETYQVTLMEDACSKFKEYLLKGNEDFIRYLIRPRMFTGIDSLRSSILSNGITSI